nr:hypothetical protein [Auraticoccus cholistanensis]
MHVAEVVRHLGGVAADVVVEGVGQPLGEQLRSLGGHDHQVRRCARRHHGEDLGEEVAPVLALDGLDLHGDLGVAAPEGGHQLGAGLGVLRGAEDGDGEGVLTAAGDVGGGEPGPRDRRTHRPEPRHGEQRAATEVCHEDLLERRRSGT